MSDNEKLERLEKMGYSLVSIRDGGYNIAGKNGKYLFENDWMNPNNAVSEALFLIERYSKFPDWLIIDKHECKCKKERESVQNVFIENCTVTGNDSIGCKTYNSDVGIFCLEKRKDGEKRIQFTDIYMDKESATALFMGLQNILKKG